MPTLFEELEKDIRFREGLKACLNCGVCTAICPAAAVSDYDPRKIVNTVQDKDEEELEKLLEKQRENRDALAENAEIIKKTETLSNENEHLIDRCSWSGLIDE